MKVLLVDNDQLFSPIVKSRLEKLGYAVSMASDGEAAWEPYQHPPFRFLITEYNLPGVGGPELCRRIRNMNRGRHTYDFERRLHGFRFCTQTNYTDRSTSSRASGQRGCDFLVKQY